MFLVVSLAVASGSATNPFLRYVPREGIQWDSSSKDDPGQPLFLTPYIQKGEIAEGELKQTKEREWINGVWHCMQRTATILAFCVVYLSK